MRAHHVFLGGMLVAALVLSATVARADEPVRVRVGLDHTTYLAESKQTGYVRVSLEARRGEEGGDGFRAPLNVAIVIDRSGSMAGQKIEHAKKAALAALAQMRPDDIVAVVAYDSRVSVLVPATKVSDRESIRRGILRLRASGSTALFAGTVKGAEEVRKFYDPRSVNRVILLSDGLANVGPDTPEDLAQLGRDLRLEGISVSTVGLGLDFNEDLMMALARSSGANFTYVENSRDLERLYRKGFGAMATIAASDVEAKVELPEGFRPVRVLGMDADILGQTATIPVNQLYAGFEQHVVVEFETAIVPECSMPVATVDVSYRWLATEKVYHVEREATARFTKKKRDVERSVDRDVMVTVIEYLADERARAAIELRDKGNIVEARRALRESARYMEEQAQRYDSPRLRQRQRDLKTDSESLEGERWRGRRKTMRRRAMRLQDDFL